MAVRTTSQAVKDTLRAGTENSDYDDQDEPKLVRFIKAASLIVDRVATCATARGYTLTSDELLEIETWLAAHNYCMSDQTYSARNTQSAGGSFHGQTGMRLEATKYGQVASSLDPSGCLNAIVNRRTASAAWLGRPPSEQTDYADRD